MFNRASGSFVSYALSWFAAYTSATSVIVMYALGSICIKIKGSGKNTAAALF